VVALAGALRPRLLLRPGAQLQHLARHRPDRHVDERTLLVGHAFADPVQARVVGAALEDGVRRVDGGAADLAHRLHQSRDVALDELVLEGQRGRRDDDPAVVEQRRDEVAQRLAGAGARLDEQVLAGVHGVRHRLGHLDLARSLLPPERLDRGAQHAPEGGVLRSALDHP
jgi:hypothetical protein